MFQIFKKKVEEPEEEIQEVSNSAMAVVQITYSDDTTKIANYFFLYKTEKPTCADLKMVCNIAAKDAKKKIPAEKKIKVESVILLNVIDYIM